MSVIYSTTYALRCIEDGRICSDLGLCQRRRRLLIGVLVIEQWCVCDLLYWLRLRCIEDGRVCSDLGDSSLHGGDSSSVSSLLSSGVSVIYSTSGRLRCIEDGRICSDLGDSKYGGDSSSVSSLLSSGVSVIYYYSSPSLH